MKSFKGFSLIELLIVVAILGILVAVFFGSREKPKDLWKSEATDLSTVKGFEDCRMTVLNTGRKELHLVRCPNSTTSNSYTEGSGKSVREVSISISSH